MAQNWVRPPQPRPDPRRTCPAATEPTSSVRRIGPRAGCAVQPEGGWRPRYQGLATPARRKRGRSSPAHSGASGSLWKRMAFLDRPPPRTAPHPPGPKAWKTLSEVNCSPARDASAQDPRTTSGQPTLERVSLPARLPRLPPFRAWEAKTGLSATTTGL